MKKLLLVVTLLCAACGGPSAPDRPLFRQSGTGNSAFDMPEDVERVRITGTYGGNSSNFIVWVGGQLVVNELLGTLWQTTTYSGVHQVVGGVTRIENSTGVVWTITEVR